MGTLSPFYEVTESKLRCLEEDCQRWRRNLYRTGVACLTGILSLMIPHLGLFLWLIGSIACSLLAIVLPGLLHSRRLDRSDASRLGDLKDMALIAFGAVGGTISFFVTFAEFIG